MRRPPRFSTQQGLSLIELMIGAAMALFIVAAAVSLLGTQLREHRSVALDARLAQDLRSTAELVGRHLRRAGYWGHAADGVWAAGATGVSPNPYAAVAPAAGASDAVSLRYSRDAVENDRVDTQEHFGFRLRAGVVETELGAGNWQALTDGAAMTVTTFGLVPTLQRVDLGDFCARPCPTGTLCALPGLEIRSFAWTLIAQSVADPRVVHSLRGEVRLRNDRPIAACPA